MVQLWSEGIVKTNLNLDFFLGKEDNSIHKPRHSQQHLPFTSASSFLNFYSGNFFSAELPNPPELNEVASLPSSPSQLSFPADLL